MIKQSIFIITTIGLLTLSASAKFNIKSCTGCHGEKLENKAMSVSKVITSMKKADIVKALHGYKDGSYGGAMKGIMKGFAKKLSDDDIATIAKEYGK
jgi:cytochrome c-type protein NapB